MMKFTMTKGVCLLLGVLLAGAGAWGQVEVLSPGQRVDFQKRLPEAIQAAASAPFKAYLQGLQRDLASAGAGQKAGLGQRIANAVRVADDLKQRQGGAGALFTWYAVPAISPVMRLPDQYPADGAFAGPVDLVAAQDEYEPGSFVIAPFADQEKVELTLSDLKSGEGTVFSKDNLDLKVVKVWYQNGNGWFSYFADSGLELVPELLLKDENLIRVDTQRKANYARVDDPKGARYVWISEPNKINIDFDPYSLPFADAHTLQPVALSAGQFKQFFLTAHVAKDVRPGLYRGSITVTAPNQPAARIPVRLRVLPFQLPLPKANYDIHKDFLVSLMGAWPRIGPEHKAFMPTLKDLRRHNILNLGPNAEPETPPDQAARLVNAMKEAGFETTTIFGGNLPWVGQHNGTPLSFDELMTVKRSAEAWRAFYLKYFGHTNAIVGMGDEPGAGWVMKTRPVWRILDELGLLSGLAGHWHIFVKAGYILDIHETAAKPGDREQADRWRAVKHSHVGFYANQHNGSENPTYVRRQHGLLGYLSDFDMVYNYEFAYGPWNDMAYDLYKPMVLAYPTSEGLVDTIEWEGFREGIDDIRYATKLRQLAQEAVDSGNLDRIYAGRQVWQWFALMDGKRIDLNAVRLEMIDKIERLMQLASSK